MVRFSDGSRIEVADARDGFVPRHVGVSVQREPRPGRDDLCRRVQKVKTMSRPLEQKTFRRETVRVAIPADGMDRRTDGLQLAENSSAADVAEVPYFIRSCEQRGQAVRQAVVGVGDDGNAHGAIVEAPRITRKP